MLIQDINRIFNESSKNCTTQILLFTFKQLNCVKIKISTKTQLINKRVKIYLKFEVHEKIELKINAQNILFVISNSYAKLMLPAINQCHQCHYFIYPNISKLCKLIQQTAAKGQTPGFSHTKNTERTYSEE